MSGRLIIKANAPKPDKPSAERSAPRGPSGPEQAPDDNRISGLQIALLCLGLIVSTAFKGFLALNSNVLWEEAHFAVAGQHLDWGYADIPPGMPAIAAFAVKLVGWSPEGLRLFGLFFAQLIPFAVWFLAEPLVGRRNAMWAAILAIVFTPLAANGAIFYPETFLQLSLLLLLGCAVRAIKTNHWIYWALTGVFGAIGLAVHYRFGLVGLGVVLFALTFGHGRALWRRPGFYLAGAIAALGLVPWVIYNVREGFASARYHAVDRLGWGFNPEGLPGHLGEQMGAAGPVFFVLLFAAAFIAWRRARTSPGAALCLATAAAIFLFYTLIVAFYRTRYAHWPFMAYAALLPFAPIAAASFMNHAKSGFGRAARGALIALGPIWTLAAAAGFGAFFYYWNKPEALPERYRGYLSFQMEDWRRLDADIARLQAAIGAETKAVAAGGHWSAVRLAFPGAKDRKIYALAPPQDRITGFDRQQDVWALGETALMADQAGRKMLILIPEDGYLYHEKTIVAYRERLCRTFVDLKLVDLLVLPPGRLAIEAYEGRPVSAPLAAAPKTCALLPALYIAQPQRGERLDPELKNAFGIAAFAQGVEKVELLIDGNVLRAVEPRIDAAGFRAPALLNFDPDYPKVQWAGGVAGGELAPGAYEFSIRATLKDGRVVESPSRTLYAPLK